MFMGFCSQGLLGLIMASANAMKFSVSASSSWAFVQLGVMWRQLGGVQFIKLHDAFGKRD